MAPLGLGMMIGGSVYGATSPAVVIEDYFWEIHTTAGAGYLTPLARGTVSDEGYWDVHTISSGNDAIKPLDV